MTEPIPSSTNHRIATREARAERGASARRTTPLAALAEHDAARRRDPLGLLDWQAESRIAELIPVRHGRMSRSAFAFYRGAALIMADDLSHTPATGLSTQLCGDAHLSNFGIFASPERRLAFDINDFDETYPGPFEWDVKRLVTSLGIAARENDFSGKQRLRVIQACASEYRTTMRHQAEQSTMAVWYSRFDPTAELSELRDELDTSTRERVRKAVAKSRSRDSNQALAKLTTRVDGRPRIISDPPLIMPIEEVFADADADDLYRELRRRLSDYRATLQDNRRALLDQFEFVQAARKVVGVGSVGTRAWIVLLLGVDGDPLILQAKEAQPSVLARYLTGPTFANQGERVVQGQRLMQAVSDILLGWQKGPDIDGETRDFYIRQLRDGKGSAVIETMRPKAMRLYGRLCGRVLAYAHARGGDRIAIASYLGTTDEFDHAVAEYAETYAEQTARDHAELLQAIRRGRLAAETES
ncbi:DUF2252 domain-containing protein [Nocardia niwae]|uniref:DUF2252 domain-containing protein n=1 Tax=Nocardia niwae TaxID=626084 RepID=A0ABV2X7X1_9NOCA|nr:DUF2252 domain-containing protein [Nocardia niwae]